MANLFLVIHVLIALAIVGLILMQQGKGAEMGASFGSGGSQTVFGAEGSGNLFSTLTGVLAAVFFGTSLFLAVSAKNISVVASGEEGLAPVVEQIDGIPTLENAIPTNNNGVPNIDEAKSDSQSDIPSE